MTEIQTLQYFLPRLFICLICGMIIGFERERLNKDAGMKTIVFFMQGVGLFTAISFFISEFYGVPTDVTRMLGQIITGLSFLGAGVIFRQEDKVKGITTSAIIWMSSSVAMLCGMGLIFLPIILSAGLLVLVNLFISVERRINKDDKK